MRYKLNIQKYDDHRVLIHNKKGLKEDAINAINQFALKNGFNDVEFATLDTDAVGLVCKPSTWIAIAQWNERTTGKKYPDGFEKDFLKQTNAVLKDEETFQRYVEELTKPEMELKKELREEVYKLDEAEEAGELVGVDKDKTWEQDEA